MATIVFCEDDPKIQKLIRVAMRETSHTVQIAGNGAAGKALIERERPDLVVLDVVMPELDGVSLCAWIKAQEHLCRIPVIFLSASMQRMQAEELRRHGAADFLSKPFSPAELRARIEDHLRRAEGPDAG